MKDSRSGQLTRREAIGVLGAAVGTLTGASEVSAQGRGRGGQGGGGGQGRGGQSRTPTKEWLDQVVEAPIETDIAIIDPHHHMSYTPGPGRYNLEDILADTKGNNVRQTVSVIGTNLVEWVNGVAAEAASGVHEVKTHVSAGIVGGGDLTKGDAAAPELEKQIGESRRFRGMRHSTGWTNPPVRPQNTTEHMLMDPQFQKGIAQLTRLGLSFEAWLYYNQLHDVVELARKFPELPIILNHIGGVLGVGAWEGKAEEVFNAWKPAIKEVATCPNVTVKVGGLGMNYLNGFGWDKRPKPATSDELVAKNRRYWEYTIESFTPNRCMFQSNFPPDKESSSYTVCWNHFKKFSKQYTKEERAAMFHDTALRVYRLQRV